jgi:hypothetical protein
MESSLPESWYPECQSSEDRLVSCAPMGAPTERSECDCSAPNTNTVLIAGLQFGIQQGARSV